jgi:hypothetical protein
VFSFLPSEADWFILRAISLAEVKASIKEMSVDERLEIAALIAHLNRADDSEYREELDRRMSAMDAGRKTSAARLEELHAELNESN